MTSKRDWCSHEQLQLVCEKSAPPPPERTQRPKRLSLLRHALAFHALAHSSCRGVAHGVRVFQWCLAGPNCRYPLTGGTWQRPRTVRRCRYPYKEFSEHTPICWCGSAVTSERATHQGQLMQCCAWCGLCSTRPCRLEGKVQKHLAGALAALAEVRAGNGV